MKKHRFKSSYIGVIILLLLAAYQLWALQGGIVYGKASWSTTEEEGVWASFIYGQETGVVGRLNNDSEHEIEVHGWGYLQAFRDGKWVSVGVRTPSVCFKKQH